MTDFEKRAVREEELKRAANFAATGTGSGAAPSTTSNPSSSSKTPEISPEAAVLYQKHDFTLKEGEHFKVEVKKSSASGGPDGFLSRLGDIGKSGGDNGGNIGKLAPPIMPPPTHTTQAQQPTTSDPFHAAAFQHAGAIDPTAGATTTAKAPAEAAKVVASSEEGWATF